MNRINTRTLVLIFINIIACVVLTPTSANADIGIPMIGHFWPVAWVFLVPVIVIEAVAFYFIVNRSCWSSIKVSSIANVITTILGIPVTWVLLVLFQCVIGGGSARGIYTVSEKVYAVTVQSPWLIPYEEELKWMCPAAAAFLCIPFFFMSVFVEYVVAKKLSKSKDSGLTKRWAWIANLLSYSILFGYLIIKLILAIA